MPRKPTDFVQFKLRIREKLRKNLEREAEKKKHSTNNEAVERLERSFVNDEQNAAALQYEVDERLKAEDELHEANKRIEQLELQLLNIGADIERAVESALRKVMK